MSFVSLFIVLIESRRLPRAVVATVTAVSMLLSGFGLTAAHAAPGGANKVAQDLEDGVRQPGVPKVKWARDIGGVRHVQAIVVSNDSDPLLLGLREYVKSIGGVVHAFHSAVHALTVQIKASEVAALSQRSDVVSVSPNRETQRTASTLESITGALTANVRTGSTKTSYSGVDGTGIGIAVLDSGVMKAHEAFRDGSGVARVKRNVNVLNSSLANWTTTAGTATSLMPGSKALTTYQASIAADTATTQDPYGHGTHVASVAAGRAKYYGSGVSDSTGQAPNANIYDVRVLNELGYGTVSDALEGIQWAIYRSEEHTSELQSR